LHLTSSPAKQEPLRSVGTPMGTSACTCTMPPEAHAAVEVTYPKLDPQARPTLLRGYRARPSAVSTEDGLGSPRTPGPVPPPSIVSTASWVSSMVASEASLRSQGRASLEPSCDFDPEGASRSNPTAFGLPTGAPGTGAPEAEVEEGTSEGRIVDEGRRNIDGTIDDDDDDDDEGQPPTSVAGELEKAQTPSSVTAARPDFSGDWLLLRLEGDIEAMLKELEVSWVQRKAAAGMGFGVGMQFVRVEQYANEIRIDTRYMSGKVQMARPRPTFNVYNTDGIEQCITDLEGCTVRTRVTWDGDALSMDSERVCRGSGRPLPSMRRYLQCDGEELVFEQKSLTTSVAVKRIFRRCKSPVAEGS